MRALRIIALSIMTLVTAALVVASFRMRHEELDFLNVRPGFSVDTTDVILSYWDDAGVIRQRGFLRVSSVVPRSPADKAGFEPGDSIIAVDGIELRKVPQAYGRAFLGAYPGKRIEFEIAANGRREHRVLVLEEYSTLSYAPWDSLDLEGSWLDGEPHDSTSADTTRGFLVTSIKPFTRGNGSWLRSGDIIVRFNGAPLESESAFFRLIQDTLQTPTNIEYLRNGVLDSTGTHLWNARDRALSDLVGRATLLPPFMLLIFLVVGATIGWVRLRDPNAFRFSLWILCWIVFLSFLPFVIPMQISWPTWALCALPVAIAFSFCLFILLTIDLFAVFPYVTRLGRIILKSKWIVFAVLGLDAIIEAGVAILGFFGVKAYTFPGAVSALMEGVVGLALAAFIALWVALIIAQNLEARRHPQNRLRIIEYALLSIPVGFTIAAVFGVIAWSLETRAAGGISPYPFAFLALFIVLVSLLAMPLLLAYGLLTRKVFGIRFILRKGLQYLLVSKGALLLEGGVIFLFVWKIIGASGSALAQSIPAMSGVATGSSVLIIAGLSRANRRIMPVIDRRFFREAYDARRLLSGLSEQLSGLRERDKILRMTAETVLKTLHPRRVVILLRDGGSGGFIDTLGIVDLDGRKTSNEEPGRSAVSAPPLRLEAEDPVIGRLEREKAWTEVYPEQLDPGIEEEKRLIDLDCELLIALKGSTGLTGVMALGGKLSEEPFSGEDRELLFTVANQVSMALENTELLEVAKREAQQARELEMAHEVQQNLFPKELPYAEGWEFAATCRPARATGGDYYDLFAIGSDHVAFALGDVSGKGLGPSLVMASVQSMVRSGLRRKGAGLTGLMGELNDHLLESTAPEMFITLFMGVLNVKTGHVRFVNGGHPPPALVKKRDMNIIPLEERSLMVGILPGFNYVEGEATIEEGDFLVLFSDGVTEAEAVTQDMFGEERLLEFLKMAGDSPASSIMETILDAVGGFTAGAEQSDDISLIVIRRVRDLIQ